MMSEIPWKSNDAHRAVTKTLGFRSTKLWREFFGARRLAGWYVAAAALMVLYLFPLGYLINTALKSPDEYVVNPVGFVQSPQFQNFATAWDLGNLSDFILNTILYTAIGATAGTLVSVLLAFPVARGYIRGGNLWNALFVVILFLPNALMVQFQLVLQLGLYDTRLGYLLLIGFAIGLGPIFLKSFFESLPRELDEAAAVDGVGYLRYLFTFVIPLGRPAILTVFILQAVTIWNEIILATVILADTSKWPISAGLNAFKSDYSYNWTLLAAATLLVATPLLLAYLFIQRYLVNGVVGAVKG